MTMSEVQLVFLDTVIDEKGSPSIRKSFTLVPCEERKQFSSHYYNSQERSMRGGLKLSIAKYYVRDELQQVEYKGKLYDVKNIMSDSLASDRYVVLDCQQVEVK